jgi:hypothetical protein
VRRFDCSFILTCPVQTSVGELDVDGYACLSSNWLLNCPIVLATRQHRPCDPCQLVGSRRSFAVIALIVSAIAIVFCSLQMLV